MELLPYTLKWFEVLLRWSHVLFAILWVGNSFLFNYLDNKLEKNTTSKEVDADGILQHSGWFYRVERLNVAPEKFSKNLIIFKWQSYLTFITGMLLLIIIYYVNAKILMIDKRVNENITIYGPRFAFLSVGVILGCIMFFNVFFVIIPNGKNITGLALNNEKFDLNLSISAKTRSVHNNIITFLVLFVMLSGHASFIWISQNNWIILSFLAIILGLIRYYFNLRAKKKI